MRHGLLIWMYAVITVFVIEHIPEQLWAVLRYLNIDNGFLELQKWVTGFFSAGYLS